jgi:CpeT/CpcT family (DUF1001)
MLANGSIVTGARRGMQLTRTWAVRFIVIAISLFVVPVARPCDGEQLERDFVRFLALWDGSYDNRRQTRPEATQGKPANEALRVEMRRVELPAFGQHVIYVEWQSLDDATKVVRQRIYVPRIDESERTLRVGLYIWPADRAEFIERTRGAHLDPTRLIGVTPADMVDLGDCDLRFRRRGPVFEGAMRRGACSFLAPDGRAIYSWTQMRVGQGRFEYLDGWFLPDGQSYRAFSSDWYRFKLR